MPNVYTVSIMGELWLCTIQISKEAEQMTNIVPNSLSHNLRLISAQLCRLSTFFFSQFHPVLFQDAYDTLLTVGGNLPSSRSSNILQSYTLSPTDRRVAGRIPPPSNLHLSRLTGSSTPYIMPITGGFFEVHPLRNQ